MEPSTAIENITGWATYSTFTRGLVVASWLSFVLMLCLFIWAGVLKARDEKAAKAAGAPAVVINKFETHIHLGDIVAPDTSLPAGWVRKLDINGRTTVETVTRDEMDLNSVETKTVGVVGSGGEITAVLRFINILEGGAWDLDSSDVLRDGKGEVVPLAERFARGQFGDRLKFADDVICVGLASRQPKSTAAGLAKLTHLRAMTLARAINVSNVMHHPQALYVLPLGGAKLARKIGTDDEPSERVAVIIGVQRADKDTVLSSDILDVVARADLNAVKLTDYTGASSADKLLGLAAPEVFSLPTPPTRTAAKVE